MRAPTRAFLDPTTQSAGGRRSAAQAAAAPARPAAPAGRRASISRGRAGPHSQAHHARRVGVRRAEKVAEGRARRAGGGRGGAGGHDRGGVGRRGQQRREAAVGGHAERPLPLARAVRAVGGVRVKDEAQLVTRVGAERREPGGGAGLGTQQHKTRVPQARQRGQPLQPLRGHRHLARVAAVEHQDHQLGRRGDLGRRHAGPRAVRQAHVRQQRRRPAAQRPRPAQLDLHGRTQHVLPQVLRNGRFAWEAPGPP
jgi:hypothetical protein